MTPEWIIYVFGLLWIVFQVVWVLTRRKRPTMPSSAAEEIWKMLGRVSPILLGGGMCLVVIVGPENDALFAFYRERFWFMAVILLLGAIFWIGSITEKRLAGATAVLVGLGLEVHSALAEHPSFRWVLAGYSAFCLVVALFALARRLQRHDPHSINPA